MALATKIRFRPRQLNIRARRRTQNGPSANKTCRSECLQSRTGFHVRSAQSAVSLKHTAGPAALSELAPPCTTLQSLHATACAPARLSQTWGRRTWDGKKLGRRDALLLVIMEQKIGAFCRRRYAVVFGALASGTACMRDVCISLVTSSGAQRALCSSYAFWL